MKHSPPDRVLECLVLPAGQVDLLLPEVCVVEVLRYQPLARAAGPRGCIGLLGWREGDVPVVDVGLLGAVAAQAVTQGRAIAILQRTIADSLWPFWAVALSGLPRKRRVEASAVALVGAESSGCPGSWVRAGASQCLIPDLASLQREQLPPVTWTQPGSL